MMPVVVAGVGLAGWGLCFYTALNVRGTPERRRQPYLVVQNQASDL